MIRFGLQKRSTRVVLVLICVALALLFFASRASDVVVVTSKPSASKSEDREAGSSWIEHELVAMNKSLYDKGNLPFEVKLRALLDPEVGRYAIAARFPLPELPLILSARPGVGGQCLVGKACELAKSPSKWNPDTHVRDIIHSLMIDCALPWNKEPCVAHDVGANIGLITHSMASMRVHVIAVEPQVDLCVALRTTLAIKGEDKKHLVLCGGVSGGETGKRMPTSTSLYRYEGKVPPPVAAQYPPTVPLYNVEQLVGPFKKLKFAKIDTDSHDCLILDQYLRLVEAGKLQVESLILETWDWSCLGGRIGSLLYKAQTLGYHVYRTLTPRNFDDNGWDTLNNYKPVPEGAPPNATEQFHQRFIRHTWKMHPRSKQEWESMVQQKDQLNRIYFVTTAVIYEQGYISA